jgi:hypothetical protein
MKTGLLLKKDSAAWSKQVNDDILPLFVKETYRFTAGRVFRVFKPHSSVFMELCMEDMPVFMSPNYRLLI